MALDFVLDLDQVLVDYVDRRPASLDRSDSIIDVNGVAFRPAKGVRASGENRDFLIVIIEGARRDFEPVLTDLRAPE